MLAVIRIRGTCDVRHDMKLTFKILRLNHKFTLAIVKDKPSVRGQLQLIKDYVIWGEVSKEALTSLEKVPFKGETIKEFRLHPPRGGFKKSTKRPNPQGELGYRGEEINKFILRMLP